jgi:hypothetical protein
MNVYVVMFDELRLCESVVFCVFVEDLDLESGRICTTGDLRLIVTFL